MEKSPIPQLQTPRLALRPFSLRDASEVQRQAGSPKIAAMTATIPHPYPDGAAEEWIAKHREWFHNGMAVNWAIELQSPRQLIGCIGLSINKAHHKAEVGYWIGEEFWGQGYCTEAAVAALGFAFKNLNLNKITSRHMAQNPASGKVMQKAGMVQEGFLKQDSFRNGQFVDLVVYGLLKESWLRKHIY